MKYSEFHSILDPFQILVINQKGKLRKLKCPFRVMCVSSDQNVHANKFYYVDQVSDMGDNKICYLIGGQLYTHSLFRIFISF